MRREKGWVDVILLSHYTKFHFWSFCKMGFIHLKTLKSKTAHDMKKNVLNPLRQFFFSFCESTMFLFRSKHVKLTVFRYDCGTDGRLEVKRKRKRKI